MRKGRPRAFDVDEAIERAMQVFWRKGYEGATLSDLTKAMGINPPSLYAAFGSKEGLFRKVVDRYEQMTVEASHEALSEPTARAVAERTLRGAADWQTDPRNPRGCFMVRGALACGDAADHLQQELSKRRAAATAALCERFERAKAEGDLPADSDPDALARYLVTIIRGMAVEAVGGASCHELRAVAEIALRAWPGAREAKRVRAKVSSRTRPAARKAAGQRRTARA